MSRSGAIRRRLMSPGANSSDSLNPFQAPQQPMRAPAEKQMRRSSEKSLEPQRWFNQFELSVTLQLTSIHSATLRQERLS